MAGLHFVRTLSFLITINLLFKIAYSTPVNISPDSVPGHLIQSAIESLNDYSPTQHTYRGGNLISAQKLLEPHSVIYRLTLNLDTVCDEGSSSCPREACTIDLKVRSEVIEIDRNSKQCMYLYPQQEDVQQLQQVETVDQEIAQVESSGSAVAEDDRSSLQNTLKLNHEVETTADSQISEADSSDNKPFIAVRAPNSNYCPGCPYELNPNLPGLAAFGAQALDVMDRLGQNDFKHKLIRIIRVTRAVPPGSNVVRYKLLAEIGETNCLKTTLIERSQCSLQGNIPVRVCLVTFEERPWQQSDRQVVGNNCTVPSELENEINAALNPVLNGNSYLVGNGQPERVDSVQEVIGKTAHIDQLAQEGKIGTYDSLIDPIVGNSPADATAEINMTEVPFFEGIVPRENSEPYVFARRYAAQAANEDRSPVTEETFVKVELERDEERRPVHGFIDKQREFDEFLSDFDIPLREPVVRVTEENRQPVVEEIIRPHKVGEADVAKNGEASSEEVASGESAERRNDRDNRSRTRRSLSRTSAKSTSELVQELAQKAADTLDDIDQDDEKRVVRRILESKRHKMVDGYLYHLVIEVALTECSERNNFETDKDCLEKTIGPTKICRVQIHAGNEHPTLHAKVLKSECLVEPAKGKGTRNRRTVGLTGSPDSISIEDEDVKNYANLGVREFSKTSEGSNESVLVEIISATSQVVAGNLYKILVRLGTSNCPKGKTEDCQLLTDSETKLCEISAWSRLWLGEDGLQIKVICNATAGGEHSAGESITRNRRGEGLGVSSSISVEDPIIKNYANLGVQKLSQTFMGPNEPILVTIKSATTQVVAGMKYNISISLGTSDCPKGKKENCQLQTNSEVKECQVVVWSRPWLGEAGLVIEVNCNSDTEVERTAEGGVTRNKRFLDGVGMPTAISVDDEEVKNYTNLGLQKFSKTFGGSNEPALVKIVNATRQVVSGTQYEIRARFGTSDCPKGKTENCQLLADSEMECQITAWSRPWLGEAGLKITVDCDTNIRSKRGLKGKNYTQKMLEQGLYMMSERLFNDFIIKYNKTYSSSLERQNRLDIFHENMMMVQELQRNEQGTAVYGASMFADLTTEEFKKKYLGLRPELRQENEIPIPMAEIPQIEIPEAYDWRNYNVVTPVKNQGSCGSCWAFSVTGNVEGQYAIRHGNLLSLSEQELVDCDTLDKGCNGGLPDNAYRSIEKLGGLELESDYPYDGADEACHFNKTEAKVKVVSAVNITSNETQMAQWLVQNGPISIGINANAMQFYMGGVSHPFKFLCSPSNLNHGVLIVGYGTHTYPIFHKTLPFWTIKNSWGPLWGEQGYYRVFRGDGTCGVNQMASSAVVA